MANHLGGVALQSVARARFGSRFVLGTNALRSNFSLVLAAPESTN